MLANKRTRVVGGILIAALVVSQGFAATLHVDPNDPTAFPTIQKAIDAARHFDTVVVHPGTYKGRIDFEGKAVTVRSIDPSDPQVVAATIIDGGGTSWPVITFEHGETEHSVLDGLTVQNGHSAVEWKWPSTATVRRCLITQNSDEGVTGNGLRVVDCVITKNRGDGVTGGYGSIIGCVVAGNNGGIAASTGPLTVTNCTIVGNTYTGVHCPDDETVTVSNSIIAYNGTAGLLWVKGGATPPLSEYNNVYGNRSNAYFNWPAGTHDIHEPPWFADNGYWADGWHNGDYHLLSKQGRWDPVAKDWVKDPIDSPCIDKGDPNTPVGDEPYPNGGRVNLGAYGGTAEASMSLGGLRCAEYPAMDFNHDCKVDQADLDLFLEHWLECGLDDPNACWPQGPPAPPHVQQ